MVPDYRRLMDAETWAFIDRINGFYPPDAINWPIEEMRAVYDRMSRAFHAGRPSGVEATDAAVVAEDRSIPIRIYRRAVPDAAALVLYFHGGGFVLGGLDSHDDICADLCALTGFELISVDYRLAPEHRGTAAFDDALAAFDWASEARAAPIVLVGESAGGNLAASLAHRTRRRARAPVGQVLIYPGLGGRMDKPSMTVHAEAPLLSARDLAFYSTVRTQDDRSGDPRFEPLGDRDFSGLPPTVVVSAECDPLSSDGRIYCERVRMGGGRAHWEKAGGLPHGFLRARKTVGRAKAAFGWIAAAVGALGRGEWPYR